MAAAWSLPDERVTTGPELAAHLLARARRNGAEVHTSTAVVRLRVDGGRCIGVETKTQCIDAPYTVLAAGAWSGLLAGDVGLNRPLIPLRRAAAHIRGDACAAARCCDKTANSTGKNNSRATTTRRNDFHWV